MLPRLALLVLVLLAACSQAPDVAKPVVEPIADREVIQPRVPSDEPIGDFPIDPTPPMFPRK